MCARKSRVRSKSHRNKPAIIVHLFTISLLFTQTSTPAVAQTDSRNVVISQVYGGGGNAGATLRNDFVELFNRGPAPVDITGWSIQYASENGTTWMVTSLRGSIGPGQYYLVQEAQGNGGSTQLPAADASGSVNLSATDGKVALVNNSAPLSGNAPTGSNVIGLVGYGAANFSEGAPTPALTNTTAAVRRAAGCTDSINNVADFATAAPNPRNTSSPRNPCVNGTLPTISAAGVTNAASFLAGPVSPGELVTIFGSNIGPAELTKLQLTADGSHVTTSLAGTRVLFDGIAAPLIYVSESQLTTVVPFELAGKINTNVQVEAKGQLSNQITLPMTAATPGAFTLTQSGRGQAAVLNQDFSINSPLNPALSGTFVSIFGTGGGQTNPPGESGKITGVPLAALSAPASVRIGGIEVGATYAGTAPAQVSGVVQINARVPDDVATADAASLILRVGDSSSQPGPTVAVRNPDGALACGSTCGVERWSVKNLTDADAQNVDFSAKPSTVGALLSLSAPRQLPLEQRIAPTELQTFQVTARLVEFKLEDDMDFHIVIADPDDLTRTMIVEIPSPDCGSACRSGHSQDFAIARTAMNQRFGAATSTFQQLHGVLVSVTGIGFFDFLHGQTGVAPNGMELHPVLRIQFLE